MSGSPKLRIERDGQVFWVALISDVHGAPHNAPTRYLDDYSWSEPTLDDLEAARKLLDPHGEGTYSCVSGSVQPMAGGGHGGAGGSGGVVAWYQMSGGGPKTPGTYLVELVNPDVLTFASVSRTAEWDGSRWSGEHIAHEHVARWRTLTGKTQG